MSPWDAIAAATHLHLGGPEFMGGEAAAQILAAARDAGIVTSADILAPGDPGLLEWIAPALPHLDYLLPNDEQVLGFTGEADVEAGCARSSSAASAASPPPAEATASSSSTPPAPMRVPAFEIDVVDTTGCGDAFSAGFLRGLALGRSRAEAAALGCAAAALVARRPRHRPRRLRPRAVDAFIASTPTR